MGCVGRSRRDLVQEALSLPWIGARNAALRTGAVVAVFAAALLAGSDAWAVCSTSGTAPVLVTCSGAVTTVNAANSTTPNANTNARIQSFNASVTATVDSTGVITGAGLPPSSNASGSTVPLTNNGPLTANIHAPRPWAPPGA